MTSIADIKLYSIPQLEILAENMRKKILSTVFTNGGHLSSNLGIVELTIALHYVFSSPEDVFIFDTGHQTYPHKLLTRGVMFSKLRQYKGMSGFSSPKESIHDPFYNGHTGTSLSQALALAYARDKKGLNYHIIAILGDGSLNSGLTLEALTQIPKNLKNFIVIINDNKLAVSETIGSLFSTLQNPSIETKKEFFSHFNCEYQGPISGHHFKPLLDTFNHLKNAKHPIIVHVETKKGHGFDLASQDPVSYHGVKPFSNENTKKTTAFSDVFGQTLLKLIKTYPDLTVITPATQEGSGLNEFQKKHPQNFLDMGIAEGHTVCFSGAYALKNQPTILSIYSSFLQRALDNVFHDVSMQNSPLILAIDRAGLNSQDGASHHGIYDLGFLSMMPNMIISQPRSGAMLQDLLYEATHTKSPFAIRYPNQTTCKANDAMTRRPVGKAEVLYEGEMLLLIGVGQHVQTAFLVKDYLEPYGIIPTIVDPIYLKPFDHDLLEYLLETHPYVATIEETPLSGSFGQLFNQFVIQKRMKNVQVLNCVLSERFIEQGSHDELLKENELDPKSIAKNILKKFNLKLDEMKETCHDCCSSCSCGEKNQL
jgi:1-deoxy-D-xylulose-5-phosphate synthase